MADKKGSAICLPQTEEGNDGTSLKSSLLSGASNSNKPSYAIDLNNISSVPEVKRGDVTPIKNGGDLILLSTHFIIKQDKIALRPDPSISEAELQKFTDEAAQYGEKESRFGKANLVVRMLNSLHDQTLTDEFKRGILFRFLVRMKSNWLYMLDRPAEMSPDDFLNSTIAYMLTRDIKKASKNSSREYRYIFRAAEEFNLLPYLKIVIEAEDTLAPKGMQNAFQKWARKKAIDLNLTELVESGPHIEPLRSIFKEGQQPTLTASLTDNSKNTDTNQVADVGEVVEFGNIITPVDTPNYPAIPKGIKVIDIDDIVRDGDGDKMLSIPSGEKVDEHLPKEPEFRWHKILDLLGDIEIRNEQINTIYRMDDTHLIDLETYAGRAQILVSDYSEIFIIRDQGFKQEKLPFYKSPSSAHYQDPTFDDESIEYLLDRADVWTFKLMNDEYARDELKKHVFTPPELLEEQAKHRVSWGNKGEALERSIITTVVKTGTLPKTTDKARIQDGPLSNVQGATYAKVSSALTRDATAKFAETDTRSIRAVWDRAVEDQPILKSFFNQASINEEKILPSIQNIIDEHGFAIEEGDFELMNDGNGIFIAGCQAQKIQTALRYGVLPSLCSIWSKEELYDPDRDYIAELQVERGLAKRNSEGQLIPI